MIVLCGHPSVGNGTVYVNANGTVYQMDGRELSPPREEQVLTLDGKMLDGAEWWFESATERSH